MNLVDRFVQRYGRPPTEVDPDYLEMLNMSKYRILDIPDKKDTRCANCGSTKNDGRKYVDFGLEVDWHGIVFLCGLCVKDIALQMGAFDVMSNKINSLVTDNEKLKNLLLAQGDAIESNLSNLMGEVKEYFAGLSANTPWDGSGSSTASYVVSSEESNESNSDSTESTTPKNTRRATKPTTSSGPENFSSLTELLSTSKQS